MGNVLVIEDDFDTLHPLAELLRLRGHSVRTAADAEQGFKLTSLQPPDVIITDIALPGKSGLHFINRVRRDLELDDLPIIVISGCGPAVLVEAEAAGANFCIEKPISLDLFWQAMALSLGDTSKEGQPRDTDMMSESESPIAKDIDRLVVALRACTSRLERDQVLRDLKKRILELHGRKGPE